MVNESSLLPSLFIELAKGVDGGSTGCELAGEDDFPSGDVGAVRDFLSGGGRAQVVGRDRRTGDGR